MRRGVTGDPIAADDAVYPDVVVEVIARHGTGNLVDVLASRESTDFDHLSAGKAFPVETLRRKVVGEAFANLTNELDRIRGDENIFVQNDDRSWQNVLEGSVAVWEPD